MNETRIEVLANENGAIDVLTKTGNAMLDLQKASNEAGESLKKWRDYSEAFNNSIELIEKGLKAVKGALDFAREAADFSEAKQNFQSYAASFGIYADGMVKDIKKASGGLVSELDIMRGATKAMQLGISSDAETIGKLYQIAAAKGDQFGKSVNDTFNEIVEAIGKGTSKSLLSLGLLPDSFGKAGDKAALLGKRVDLLKTVLEQGTEELDRLSGAGDSTADQIERFDASIVDLNNSFTEKLLPSLTRFVDFGNSSLIPFLEGGIEWFDQWILRTDAETEALKKLVQFHGQAGQLGELSKRKQEINESLADYGIISGTVGVNKRIIGDAVRKIENLKNELEQAYGIGEGIKNIASANRINILKNEIEIQKQIIALENEKEKIIEQENKILREGGEKRTEDHNKQRKAIDEQKAKFADMHESAGIATDKHKKKVQDLFDAYSGVQREADKFYQRAIDASGVVLEASFPGMGSGFANLFDPEKVIKTTQKLQEELEKIRDEAKGITEDFTDAIEEGIDLLDDEDLFDFEKDIQDELDKVKFKEEKTKEFSLSIADAFEAGLNEGLNGGNFLESFGNALRRQAIAAFSGMLTQSIFSGGGGNILSYVGGSGTSYKLPSGSGVSAGGGGFNPLSLIRGGGFGGLGLGADMMAPLSYLLNPEYRLANTAAGASGLSGFMSSFTNPAFLATAGMAFLSQPGRLFGGTVQHGEERIAQGNDINSRVSQAISDRWEMLYSTAGADADSVEKLRKLKFYGAELSWNDSGDGIFSKKTRTYELDATKANESLEAFKKLSEEISRQIKDRQFWISMTGLNEPLTALEMRLQDLNQALEKMPMTLSTGFDQKNATRLEIEQINQQIWQAFSGRVSDWLNFTSSNPLSMLAPGKEYVFGNYNVADRTNAYVKNPTMGTGANVTLANGAKMSGYNFQNYMDTQLMMQGLSTSANMQFEINKQIAAGKLQSEITIAGKTLLEIITDQMGEFQSIMDEIALQIQDTSISMEQRTTLFGQWQTVNNAYWTAQQNALQLQTEQMNKQKAAQEEAARAAEQAAAEAERAATVAAEEAARVAEAQRQFAISFRSMAVSMQNTISGYFKSGVLGIDA
ncbi:MAG: hypothetical protein HQM10_26500, partial [Candidatus Riflebacteria bacterium]|nr:hypothetical protein [Candidatus Riflebacteria bacterium]